jgi:hypothetical protein
MMASQGSAASLTILLNPVSAANTAAATGAWVDVKAYQQGEVVVLQHIGAVTGSIAGKIQDADDNSGTNVADVSGATFSSVSAANNLQKLVMKAGSTRRWIRYLGTVTTGPALTQVALMGHPGSV